MALQQQFNNPFGSGTIPLYFRLVETNLNYADNIGRVLFYGYMDREAAHSRKTPVATVSFSFNPPSGILVINASGNGPVDSLKASFYNFAKEQKQFMGATDV